jgi:FixJ family two-component response regulator
MLPVAVSGEGYVNSMVSSKKSGVVAFMVKLVMPEEIINEIKLLGSSLNMAATNQVDDMLQISRRIRTISFRFVG